MVFLDSCPNQTAKLEQEKLECAENQLVLNAKTHPSAREKTELAMAISTLVQPQNADAETPKRRKQTKAKSA